MSWNDKWKQATKQLVTFLDSLSPDERRFCQEILVRAMAEVKAKEWLDDRHDG